MLRIAIVEDEESYISVLKDYLERYKQESGEQIEVTVYHDGDEIAAFYRAQFDIILMDIEMKFIDGMTAAEEIREVDSSVFIIFITNTPQYAIRGYEVGALDYILKPVSYFIFYQKLTRAVVKLKKRREQWITIAVKGGVMRVALSDIYYIESEGHNLIYHMKDGPAVSSATLKSVEPVMEKMSFVKINKCYLVNLEHVDGVKDKYAVVRGENLLISRSRMKPFMQELTRYWGRGHDGNNLDHLVSGYPPHPYRMCRMAVLFCLHPFHAAENEPVAFSDRQPVLFAPAERLPGRDRWA